MHLISKLFQILRRLQSFDHLSQCLLDPFKSSVKAHSRCSFHIRVLKKWFYEASSYQKIFGGYLDIFILLLLDISPVFFVSTNSLLFHQRWLRLVLIYNIHH